MILKGNIRANGQELASHLLNDHYEIDPEQHKQRPFIGNEKVDVAEVRGFVADDLHGAFAEAEAIAKGTKSTKPLYSLSINPSQTMSREEYGRAIDKIERKLGLDDQARAVVFHVKNGREHCHVVWSRIDAEKMQARHMEFDRQKLREVARELCRDFGHEMPKHLAEDRGVERFNEVAPTLAEQGQQSRSGIDPQERREMVTQAYEQADSAGAFRHALQERGYTLAQGDKRGFVVVDMAGEVHSLTRQINGAKAKDIQSKLDLKSVHDLPSVQEAKALIAEMERQKADIATQERPDSPDRVEVAQDALKALTVAQKAELKAMKGAHNSHLADIRTQEAERIEEAKRAIKEAYRPEWGEMAKRHIEEMKAVTTLKKSPMHRLQYILDHKNMDKFDKGARKHLSKTLNWLTKSRTEQIKDLRVQLFTDESKQDMRSMFKFVVKGEMDFKKIERRHAQERKEVGNLMKLAERAEIGAIRQEISEKRRDARDEHLANVSAVKTNHADELTNAVKSLEVAREITEREGRDPAQRLKSLRNARGFELAKQGLGLGFSRQGFDWGRDDKEREEDETERILKPPGQSLTPK